MYWTKPKSCRHYPMRRPCNKADLNKAWARGIRKVGPTKRTKSKLYRQSLAKTMKQPTQADDSFSPGHAGSPNSKRQGGPISIENLLGSLKSMQPSVQLDLWKRMIEHHPFNLQQLRSIRSAIDDRIRLDIISGVPYEIASYIMSLLSPEDLCQAAQTCRSWRTVCEDNRLWREKCEEEGLLEDELTLEALFKKRITTRHSIHEKFLNKALTLVPKSEWKSAYLRHMSILRNWRTKNFEISEPFIAPNPVPDTHQPLESGPSNLDVSSTPQRRVTRLQKQLARNSNQGDSQSSTQPQKQLNLRTPKVKQEPKDPEANCSRDLTLDGSNSWERDGLSNQAGQSSANDFMNEDFFGNDPSENSESFSLNNSHRKSNVMQLRCHEDSVITCLQFNPRTNTIVSGSDDQTLKVWSSETGRCITTLEGHTGGVWSSQLSPDDIVISGSTDRTLKVWKAQTGELLHTLYGHTSTVRCLALDGDFVISGSRDTTLRRWDIHEGTCTGVFVGHTAAVRCVEYKNNIIVSGAYDHLVMVWDALTGICLHALECHYSRIYSLQFDGKTIASGSLDSTICIWDAATGKLRHHLEGHQSLTSKMQLRGNLLVSANADSYCKVWDINTGECLQTLGGENKHTSAITSVYFNNRHVVTSSDDGTVKLWDIKTGNFIRDLVVLPTASKGGVVWRIRASYTKLICAVGSRTQTEDTHLLVLDFNE